MRDRGIIYGKLKAKLFPLRLYIVFDLITHTIILHQQGRCSDNSDVSHQHTFNVAVFNRSSLNDVKSTLKTLRRLLDEVGDAVNTL